MDSDYDIFDNQDETDSEEGARSESIDTGNKGKCHYLDQNFQLSFGWF